MDDFDPIPPISPFFRGLAVAVIINLMVLAVLGAILLAVELLT